MKKINLMSNRSETEPNDYIDFTPKNDFNEFTQLHKNDCYIQRERERERERG
ncbi:MAG: hypothetical protein LBP59_03235 [Planctomycetaceae bacterium]|jgi:hypothetical protein|nr:hypothetical protein [Planctomycetaceae bacterium]